MCSFQCLNIYSNKFLVSGVSEFAGPKASRYHSFTSIHRMTIMQ